TLAVAQDARGGRDDGDAQALEGALELVDLAVDPAADLRHALDAVDDRLAPGAVLEADADLPLATVLDDIEAFDVTLALKDGGDAAAYLAVEHEAVFRVVPSGVADAGEHVRDR